MSFYIQIDGEQQDQIASNTGWGDYGRWVKLLDPDEFPETRSLYEDGWANPAELIAELPLAIEAEKPDEDVSSVVDSLISELKDHKTSTVVSMTDGMGGDENESIHASLQVQSTEPITEEERKRRREFLLLLLAFFMWQADAIVASAPGGPPPLPGAEPTPPLSPTAPIFNLRLAKILTDGMTQTAAATLTAGPVGVPAPAGESVHPPSPLPALAPGSTEEAAARSEVADIVPNVAAKVADQLNQTTEKNIAAAVKNGATREEAIDSAVRKAVVNRATLIEDDLNHVAIQIAMAAWFKTNYVDLMQWNTREDERVCQICGPLEGLRAKPGGEFRPGIRWPVIDSHGNCRCFLTEVPA